jgi:uncharacterized membrane protein YbhN (UPF0104 family)
MLAVACTQLLSLVPVHVMGGIGTFDVTLLYLFELLGVPLAAASVFLVSYRLVFYALNGLMLGCLPLASVLHLRRPVEQV